MPRSLHRPGLIVGSCKRSGSLGRVRSSGPSQRDDNFQEYRVDSRNEPGKISEKVTDLGSDRGGPSWYNQNESRPAPRKRRLQIPRYSVRFVHRDEESPDAVESTDSAVDS